MGRGGFVVFFFFFFNDETVECKCMDYTGILQCLTLEVWPYVGWQEHEMSQKSWRLVVGRCLISTVETLRPADPVNIPRLVYLPFL